MFWWTGLEFLGSQLSVESQQVATCADALKGFGDIARRLQKGKDRDEFAEALDSCLPAVIQHAEVPKLKESLRDLQGVLQEFDLDGSRVLQVRELLSEATRRLLPKGSDEPEAAHPH